MRAALSTSAQHELLTRLKELSLLGVPALAKGRAGGHRERAWFEQQPLRITHAEVLLGAP